MLPRYLRRSGLLARAAWALAFAGLLPLTAAAQGADQPRAIEWLFRWLNFALVFGVGGYYAVRAMKSMYRKRAGEIAASIAEAESTWREAEQKLKAAEEKLAGVEREAEAMLERSRRDSAAEADRIRELAREEAARVERAADAEIAAAERAAMNALKDLAIQRTLERARAVAAGRVTPAVDDLLFRRYVQELEAQREAS